MPADPQARKVQRLYQLVWCALTKYLVKMVHTQGKAVEIPYFLIVGPQIEDWAFGRDPLNKGPTDTQTYTVKNPAHNRAVKLFLHSDFLDATSVQLAQYGDKAVS